MEIIGGIGREVCQQQSSNEVQEDHMFLEINMHEDNIGHGPIQQENVDHGFVEHVNIHRPNAEHQNDYVEELAANSFWEKKITRELKDEKMFW